MVRTAPTPVATAQPSRAARSSGISFEIGTTARSDSTAIGALVAGP